MNTVKWRKYMKNIFTRLLWTLTIHHHTLYIRLIMLTTPCLDWKCELQAFTSIYHAFYWGYCTSKRDKPEIAAFGCPTGKIEKHKFTMIDSHWCLQ